MEPNSVRTLDDATDQGLVRHCHGFFVLAPDAPVTKQCMHNMQEWLRRQLGAGR